jgi:hypothetical protein
MIYRRTWRPHRVGQVLITVLVDAEVAQLDLGRQRCLAELNRRMIRLLSAHRLPITWALGDPARSPATPLILRAGMEHELAILGDSYWTGHGVGRPRFAGELARRIAQARAAGLEVTSLVGCSISIEPNMDLLVKQGITAVLDQHSAGSTIPQRPRALYYGVWGLTASERLPLRTSWFGGHRRALLRRIDRVARDETMMHLVIDSPEVAKGGAGGERILGRVAQRVAELRDRGHIRLETMRAAAARMANVPASRPQRSILRAA